MDSTRVLECIYFLWASYKMKVSKCILKELIVALEDGYLEKLFLKESIEQGKHFDSPASVSKIVRPPKTLSLLFPVTHHTLPAPTEPRHFAASQFPVNPLPRCPVLLLTPYAQDLTSSRASSANTISPLTISLSPT